MSSLFNVKGNWVINSILKSSEKTLQTRRMKNKWKRIEKSQEIHIPRGTTTYTNGDTREDNVNTFTKTEKNKDMQNA